MQEVVVASVGLQTQDPGLQKPSRWQTGMHAAAAAQAGQQVSSSPEQCICAAGRHSRNLAGRKGEKCGAGSSAGRHGRWQPRNGAEPRQNSRQ